MNDTWKGISLLLAALALLLVPTARPLETWDRSTVSLVGELGGELVDRPAPLFELSDLSGQRVRLGDLRGQAVFLNFWASWCEPCREEMPSMVRLAQSLEDRPFVMVAVSLDADEEALLRFLRDNRIDPASMLILRDPEGELARRYGTELLPETWIVSPEGRIVARFQNAYEWTREEVRTLLERVMRGRWRAS